MLKANRIIIAFSIILLSSMLLGSIMLISLPTASLPQPSFNSKLLEEAISRRQSIHPPGSDYTDQNITEQQLSQILWAAYGYSLNETDHRTIPSVNGSYPLIIFATNATATYKYIPENHSITLWSTVNRNDLFGGLGGANGYINNASTVLIIVWNQTHMSNEYFAFAEVGCVVQNVYLEANVLELGTCCVSGFPVDLQSDLGLGPDQKPVIVMPVGYPNIIYPPASPNYDMMTGNLPPVQFSDKILEMAINDRLCTRAWSDENLSAQEISQLLWAAYGYTSVSSPSGYHRTVPSAWGVYPLIIYVSNATGTYQYIPETHNLTETSIGDKRYNIAVACANQIWAAEAPAILTIAYNSTYNNHNGTGDWLPRYVDIEAGCVTQELYLEAAAWNLGTVLIGGGLEDWNGTGAATLRSTLNLPDSIIPLFTMPVGHPFIIIAKYGSTPIMDGIINTDEWNDADKINFTITDGLNCTTYLKQDGSHLYIALNIPDTTQNISDRAVVGFDINHNHGSTPQTDDRLFIVFRNGTESENSGNGTDWNIEMISGWSSACNSTASGWQIEFEVIYSKINVTAGEDKTLGVIFETYDEDVNSRYSCQPGMALDNPDSWGNLNSTGYSWVPEMPLPSILVILMVFVLIIYFHFNKHETKLRIRKCKS